MTKKKDKESAKFKKTDQGKGKNMTTPLNVLQRVSDEPIKPPPGGPIKPPPDGPIKPPT